MLALALCCLLPALAAGLDYGLAPSVTQPGLSGLCLSGVCSPASDVPILPFLPSATWEEAAAESSDSPLRICVVIPQMDKGETDKRYLFDAERSLLALASALAARGHSVTVASITREKGKAKAFPLTAFAAAGEAGLKNIVSVTVGAQTQYQTVYPWQHSHRAMSYNLQLWLEAATPPFDIAHIPEMEGYGFYPAVARFQGISLKSTMIVAAMYGPRHLRMHDSRTLIKVENGDLEVDFMERQTMLLADTAFVTSPYLAEWAQVRTILSSSICLP